MKRIKWNWILLWLMSAVVQSVILSLFGITITATPLLWCVLSLPAIWLVQVPLLNRALSGRKEKPVAQLNSPKQTFEPTKPKDYSWMD